MSDPGERKEGSDATRLLCAFFLEQQERVQQRVVQAAATADGVQAADGWRLELATGDWIRPTPSDAAPIL